MFSECNPEFCLLNLGLVWFGVDYGLQINDPLWEILSGPLPSVSKRTGEVKIISMGRARHKSRMVVLPKLWQGRLATSNAMSELRC